MPTPQNDKNEQNWYDKFRHLLRDKAGQWRAVSFENEIDFQTFVSAIAEPFIEQTIAQEVLKDRVQTREKADRLARSEERERMAAWMKEHKYDFGCYDEGCPFYNDLAAEAFIKYPNTNEE